MKAADLVVSLVGHEGGSLGMRYVLVELLLINT